MKLARVLATLKARGVEPADIQTSEISLTPNFGRNGVTRRRLHRHEHGQRPIRDLDTAGAIVAAAAGAGANDMSGLIADRLGQNAVYQRALKAAVADAGPTPRRSRRRAARRVGELRIGHRGQREHADPARGEGGRRVPRRRSSRARSRSGKRHGDVRRD